MYVQRALSLPTYTALRSIALGAAEDVMAGQPKVKSRVKKLGKKLQDYLDDNKRSKNNQRKSLKKVLRKLKKRLVELEASLASAPRGEDSKTIKKHIAVVRAMRKKGIQALKESKA